MNSKNLVISLSGYSIYKFNHEKFIEYFNKNRSLFIDDELPNFHEHYLNDSCSECESLMSFAYCVYYDSIDEPISYYSLSNIHIPTDFTILDKSNIGEHHKFIPGVLLQNFSVLKPYRGEKHGSMILGILKMKLLNNLISAARVLVADSLIDSTGFYLKNKFEFLTDSSTPPVQDDTIRMYFDLFDLM